MARQHWDAPRTFGRIEQLEDRRVMSADPLIDLLPSVDQFALEEPPMVDQHVLGDADFLIDTSHQTDLDGYFGGVEQMLTQAHNLTGWFNVQNNYGFTGVGQTVAVIDSGIAWDHFALGGGLGANYRVVGGWDFTEENDANPYDDGASGGHGTHVSGIVGSSNGANTGVAPGVDLVGLRVFNDAGQGFFSWIENALKWVHTNRNSFENPITAINLSLGVSSWNSATIPAWANLEDEFAQLKADGIFIAVSAGNSYSTYNTAGLSYPASSQYVVPVMSTNDAGTMSPFSQRLGRAIAAPGQNIVSTAPDYKGNNNGVADDFVTMSGTSMAAPYVAGASVLVRQAMQFVGMTNINQDTIYNHMMATADTFFDSATNQNYKRLNLARAIDSLMPADDFGSTMTAAYNLGTMTGATSTAGRIGQLTDVDCFKFTAASTGTVTFTATASAGMTPSWQLWGATANSQNGGAISFNVVAGQSYTVGLSSPTGLGTYTVASALSSSAPFTFTDWGSVASNQIDNVVVNGEAWYRVTATRAGILTATGAFNTAGGNVNVAFYNTNLQLLANGTTAAGVARTDITATAGGTYYVRVSGANSDVDFKLINLVTQTGTSVSAVGTSGADAFTFTAGATNVLLVNGIGYGWASSAATQFTIDGAGGTDSIVFQGSTAAETVTLRATGSTFVSAGLTVTANNFENQTAYSGGGADVANLYDSAGNDSLASLWNKATLTLSTGQVLEANGFAKTKAWATAGGTDTAVLTDSTGNDMFIAGALRGIMTGVGFWNEAEGFDQTLAQATSGGFDSVEFYDSAGNDLLSAWTTRVTWQGSGFFHDARGFDKTTTYATTGYDEAVLYDSAGNDAFTAWSDRATLVGASFSNEVRGFKSVKAYATGGGVDTAKLYDSAGNDFYIAGALRGVLYGNNFWNQADGFDQTTAYATAGGYDRADYYDSAGNDAFSAWATRATFVGAGFAHEAQGFDFVKAWATAGGVDAATFYDSAGVDYYIAGQVRGILTGAGYWNEAEGFDSTTAYSTSGADRADFYDSAGADLYTAWWNRATFTGAGFTHDARGFKSTKAWSTQGGADRAVLYDSLGNDLYIAGSVRAIMTGVGFWNEAEGFRNTEGHATLGGNDRADMYGSAGVDTLAGSDDEATFSGTNFRHDFDGFDQVFGRGFDDNDDVDLNATDYAFAEVGV